MEEIINNVMQSPENTNPNVLRGQLQGISGGSGGGATEPYVEYIIEDLSGVPNALTAMNLHGFTSIPIRGFASNFNLKTVDFTESPNLSNIGKYAFYGCAKLALTSLPEGITNIEQNAFQDCTVLALTSLPNSLTTIDQNAFSLCKALAITILPSSITNVGSTAFSGCTSLENIEIGANSLGLTVFQNCTGLKKVWIRSSCTSIVAGAGSMSPFKGCSDDLEIYVEPSEKPDGWGEYFNRTGSNGSRIVTVTYGQTTRPW